MKIKKYLAKTVDEALSQIKKELGSDAYILSTKKVVKKGNLNLSRVDMFEVTAAVDSQKTDQQTISGDILAKKYGSVDLTDSRYPVGPGSEPADFGTKESVFKGLAWLENEIQPIRQEVEEIKSMLHKKAVYSDEGPAIELKGIFLELYLNLIENGVEKNLAKKIIESVRFSSEAADQINKEALKKRLFNRLMALISPPSPIKFTPKQRKIVVMAGPTGVGKTTTIAKLASYYKLMEAKKIALLTIDGYRIGSEAHLRTYAGILDVPFYSIYDSNDLDYRLNELHDFDLVFIDTSGRSPKDLQGINQISRVLKTLPADQRELFMLLSATTKTSDLISIYKGFSILNPDKMIYTKIDESESIGNLLNIQMRAQIPAAYFTTGQKVPEDIEIAYPRRFARLIMSN